MKIITSHDILFAMILTFLEILQNTPSTVFFFMMDSSTNLSGESLQ